MTGPVVGLARRLTVSADAEIAALRAARDADAVTIGLLRAGAALVRDQLVEALEVEDDPGTPTAVYAAELAHLVHTAAVLPLPCSRCGRPVPAAEATCPGGCEAAVIPTQLADEESLHG